MIKTMLSGTAVALLLVASPALAQTTTDQQDEQVQAQDQTETQAQDEPTAPEALDDDTDAAQTEDLDTDTDAAEVEDLDAPDTEAAETDELDTDTEAAEIDTDEDVAEAPTETFLTMQEEEDVLASELMGASVENPEGETLGSINDVVINDDLGVKAVVIGVGGFLGIGQKSVAVNYQEIEQRRENGSVTLVFSATNEELENAPEFQTLDDQIAEAEQQEMEVQQDTMQQDQPPAPPPQ